MQRKSSYCETKGEWIFALENLKQNLENLSAMVSYISNSMRKTVESRQKKTAELENERRRQA